MISDSLVAYVWVVFWATVLHSIGPLSTLYCLLSVFLRPILPTIPLFIKLYALAESSFYIWTILYQKYVLQRPAQHPARLSREDRSNLFDRCQDSTADHVSYIEKWFLGKPLATIKADNIKEFLRWAFFGSAVYEPEHEDEVDEYLTRFEAQLDTKFDKGRADVKCIRLTIDKVGALHRSLTWYACILVVDLLTHTYMSFHRFTYYRTSIRKCLAIIPPRPQAVLASTRSAAPDIAYWYRPHTSTTEVPILFLHGIGVGLYPYMQSLKELNEGRSVHDGDIGVLAIEILAISSRITSTALRKEALCDQIRTIVDRCGPEFDRFLLMSHSYGSVITTHILRTPDLADRVASVVLIDPISILLHQPDVAYNFTVRKPTLASEWLLWYFGSKDIGVAHTLSRTFFWSENILWKEDLLNHRATIYLAARDSVINAGQIRRYLLEREEGGTEGWGFEEGEDGTNSRDHDNANGHINGHTNGHINPDKPGEVHKKQSEKKDKTLEEKLKVVWCPNLNHGEVFDLPVWRANLRRRVLGEARRRGGGRGGAG